MIYKTEEERQASLAKKREYYRRNREYLRARDNEYIRRAKEKDPEKYKEYCAKVKKRYLEKVEAEKKARIGQKNTTLFVNHPEKYDIIELVVKEYIETEMKKENM